MAIEVRGIPGDRVLRGRIERQLTTLLKRFAVSPIAAEVQFFDDDGPKGGVAIRCAVLVRVPFRPSMRVEHVAKTPRLAFDGAWPVVERQLARYQERAREARRRPKKYYVAKRAWAPGTEAPAGGPE
jgi:ribosome-associated translation inhibitor RaiA